MPPMAQLLFTTEPGLEDIVLEEFQARVQTAGLPPGQGMLRPFGHGGHVQVDHPSSAEELAPILVQMRSVHHVLRFVHRFTVPREDEALATIAKEVGRLEIPELRTARTFRVTANRSGTHPFTSMDVAREAGAAIVERYGLGVDLTGYDVNIRVDIFDDTAIVGVQLTRDPLSRRHTKVYSPRAALKTTVAYAMLRLARIPRGPGRLLDPFCGSGTILLEAGSLYPDLRLYGCDRFQEPVEGARRNLEANGLAHRAQVLQADARDLHRIFPAHHFQAIVTNPPFGLRLGRRTDFDRLYTKFLRAARGVLAPEGRLVVLVHRRGPFNRAARRTQGLRIVHVRAIETGDVYPYIFVLERSVHLAGQKAQEGAQRPKSL